MFERNNSRDFLSAGKARRLLKLEALEDRAVPAVVGAAVVGAAAADMTMPATNPTVTMTPTALPATATVATTPTPGTAVYTVNFSSAPTDAARVGTVPKFNMPAGNILTSVEIIAQGSTSTTTHMENLGDQPGSFDNEVNADIRYNVGGTILEAMPTVTNNVTLPAFDGTADLKGSSSTDFGGPIVLNGSFTDTTLTSEADLAPFKGAGSVDVAQEASATSCSCGTGNLLSMVNTKSSGNVQVIYHYTPATPTPSPDTLPPTPTPDTLLPSKDLFIFYL